MLLTLFGEDEVDHAAAVFGVRGVLDERHHVGNLDRAFDRDHEFDRGAVGVLGAVGVEVVVKEDGNFAREAARVGRLLRNDRGEFVQLLEVVEGRPEVVERAAQSVVHGDGAGVAHEGGRRIEKAHHPFVLRVEQVLPSLRNGQAVERFGNRLVGQLERFLKRLALDHLGCHRAGRDRRAAAEGLELDTLNDPVVRHLEVDLHDVAALGVANLADAVCILDLAHVARMGEVIEHLFTVLHNR